MIRFPVTSLGQVNKIHFGTRRDVTKSPDTSLYLFPFSQPLHSLFEESKREVPGKKILGWVKALQAFSQISIKVPLVT